MAYSRYGWGQKAANPTPLVPLVPAVDPEHLTPAATPEFTNMNPVWMGFQQPSIPEDLVGEQTVTVMGGGGPIDYTPDDPSFGVGGGPGLTTLESQQIRGELMSADYGAVAARQWQPLTSRYDGSGPHVAIIYDETGLSDSPQTNQYERTGVGQPNDPFARVGKRIKRWWDRTIDMHRYDVTYRPTATVNAYAAPPQPPVPGGNQYDSPYATAATEYMGPPDKFVQAQMRRVPDAGTDYAGDGLNGDPYGIGQWGL